jgi:hypothetical protein
MNKYAIEIVFIIIVSELVQLTANSEIFQLYHGESKLIYNEMKIRSTLYLINMLSLIFYSASSLKQQSVDKHVGLLGHIIPIPSLPVFALSP